jgi:hypothetical protein
VSLNARNVLGPKKRSASVKWNSLIGDALNNWRTRGGAEAMPRCRGEEEAALTQEHETFRCVASKQMVGIFVTVWARSALRRHVGHPAVSCVGVLGRLGNKARKRKMKAPLPQPCRMRHSHHMTACGMLVFAGRGVRPTLAARNELLLRVLPPGLWRRGGRRAAPERRRGGYPLEDELPRRRRRHRRSCP